MLYKNKVVTIFKKTTFINVNILLYRYMHILKKQDCAKVRKVNKELN